VMLVTGAAITPGTVIFGLTIRNGVRSGDSGGGIWVTGGARAADHRRGHQRQHRAGGRGARRGRAR
jgi:hypothetical protein